MSQSEIQTTSQAIQALTNANARFNAAVAHVCEGGPLNDPGLVSEIPIEPNPDVYPDLASQIEEIASQVDIFYTCAATKYGNSGQRPR